jgi:hypothetical protein
MQLIHGLKRRLSRYKELLDVYADEKTIFVYQMGKVGSTTLENSLKNVINVHAFYNKNHTCPIRLQGFAKFGLGHMFIRLEQEVLAFLLRKAFRGREHTKIITLVREPVVRNISMFFHDLDAYLFAAHTNCMNTRQAPLPTRCQDKALLLDVFEHEFDHEYALNWFDNEFAVMTGINVYDYPFNKELGYCLINKPSIDVLCLRTDKINDCIDALSEFTDCKLSLLPSNRADNKWYSEVYKQFYAAYSSSSLGQARNIVESKFFKHFFAKNYSGS